MWKLTFSSYPGNNVVRAMIYGIVPLNFTRIVSILYNRALMHDTRKEESSYSHILISFWSFFFFWSNGLHLKFIKEKKKMNLRKLFSLSGSALQCHSRCTKGWVWRCCYIAQREYIIRHDPLDLFFITHGYIQEVSFLESFTCSAAVSHSSNVFRSIRSASSSEKWRIKKLIWWMVTMYSLTRSLF